MPNYGLVVTPQYNPMSYEQYAKPFEDYAKVYNQMADTYDALEMEANQWEKLAQNAKDAPQYQQYKRYADDLRNAASDLADNGLSVKTRGTLSRLRKRYANEIKPIADAYALREEEMKLQRQARLTHPDIMFSREAADTGLGAYMAGVPEFQTYTEGMLTKNVSDAAKNLATEASEDLRRNGPKSKWYTILGGKYYEKATRTGLTAEDVLSSMFNPQTGEINPNANPYLEQILNDALKQSGISSWENWDSLKGRAYGALNRGLWDAIGKVDYKNLQNPEWELNEKERRAALAAQAANQLPINPRNIYSTAERKAAEKYYKDMGDYIKKNADGEWELTKAGKEYWKNYMYDSNGQPINLNTSIKLKSTLDFGDLVLKLIQEQPSGTAKNGRVVKPSLKDYSDKTIAALVGKYFEEKGAVESPYDATRFTEYNFAYDQDQQKDIRHAVMGVTDELPEVDWDPKKQTYVNTGNTIKLDKFSTLDFLESNFSKIGDNINSIVTLSNGKKYRLPAGINKNNEGIRNTSLAYAENTRSEIVEILKSLNEDGQITKINPVTGVPYTVEEYNILQGNYRNQLQNAYKAHSQIGLRNKVKPNEYVGYGN